MSHSRGLLIMVSTDFDPILALYIVERSGDKLYLSPLQASCNATPSADASIKRARQRSTSNDNNHQYISIYRIIR